MWSGKESKRPERGGGHKGHNPGEQKSKQAGESGNVKKKIIGKVRALYLKSLTLH